MEMNPSSLSEIYGEMIGFPIALIIFVFLPIFFLIKRSFKGRGDSPRFKKSVYGAYFMIVLLLFLDVIVAPLKFQQLCRDLAGFHGEPFPKGKGLVLPKYSLEGCSPKCKIYLRTGFVGFIEQELAPKPNQGSEPTYIPGKYRFFIHHATDPICKFQKIYRKEVNMWVGKKIPVPERKYEEFCLTKEKIDRFEAQYEFKEEAVGFPYPFNPIGLGVAQIEDRQTGKVIGGLKSVWISRGWLENQITQLLLGLSPTSGRCRVSAPAESLIVGWK